MPEHPFDRAVHHAHCLPFGAHPLDTAPGASPRTRFRFWAPACKAVRVEIEYDSVTDLVDMHATGNGWFEAQAGCGAGARYRYLIDSDHGVGRLAVPDPASRFQPEDVHGPSEVIAPRAYAWQHPEWQGRP